MRNISLLSICILLLGLTLSTLVSAESKFSASASLAHYQGFRDDIDPFSVISAGLSYKLNSRHSLSIGQAFTKLYYIDEVGGEEFKPSDSSINHSFLITKDWFHEGVALSLKNSLSVPISEKSRNQQLITKYSAKLSFSKSFINDRLSLSYSPDFAYYFNKYAQTKDGILKRKASVGNSLSANFKVFNFWHICSAASAGRTFSEKSKFQTEEEPSNGYYSFSSCSSFTIAKGLSSTIGYQQSDLFVKDGRYEIEFFNGQTASYYINMSYAF